MVQKKRRIENLKPPDDELVVRAIAGDERAFEDLVQRYDHHVLSIAKNYTDDPDDARDIYQEVFLRVFRALPRFQGRSKFSTWLYRIVTNVCLTHVSQGKRHHGESLSEDIPETGASSQGAASIDEELAKRHLSRRLMEGIDGLSPQQRMVLTLRHHQGYKLREIAEMMNCAEGTVKKHLFTAIRNLRVHMAGSGE